MDVWLGVVGPICGANHSIAGFLISGHIHTVQRAHLKLQPFITIVEQTSLSVLQTIERVNRQLGTLIVIITHNSILGEMADRIIRLSHGRILTVERNYMPRPACSLGW